MAKKIHFLFFFSPYFYVYIIGANKIKKKGGYYSVNLVQKKHKKMVDFTV